MRIGKKELIIKDVEVNEAETTDVEEDTDMEKTSFIKKHWKKLVGGAALIGGAIAAKKLLSRSDDDEYDDYDEDLDEETEDTAEDTTDDK